MNPFYHANDAPKNHWERSKPTQSSKQSTYRDHLRSSLDDELCDAGFFSQINNEAPTKEQREIIMSIVGEEYGHAQIQAVLLRITTPPPHRPPRCPSAPGRFEADIETAIKCELDAIRRYSWLRSRTSDPRTKDRLASILNDEYTHVRMWAGLLSRWKQNEELSQDDELPPEPQDEKLP